REPRRGAHPDESRCAAHRTAVGPLERRHSSTTAYGCYGSEGAVEVEHRDRDRAPVVEALRPWRAAHAHLSRRSPSTVPQRHRRASSAVDRDDLRRGRRASTHRRVADLRRARPARGPLRRGPSVARRPQGRPRRTPSAQLPAVRPVEVRPEDTAILQYTGGTTGVPKGAVLSHHALVANIRQSRSWNPTLVEGLERGVDVMPLFHVYGLTVIMGVSIATGSAMVLIPRFDLEHVLLAIQKHRPRSFAGAPRIYVAAASAPDLARYDLRSVEVFQSGSAPLPVEVQTKFEQLAGGGRVLEGYGLTEAAPVT